MKIDKMSKQKPTTEDENVGEIIEQDVDAGRRSR